MYDMSYKKPLRILIVEDQPAFQELVTLILAADPRFKLVHTASNGEQALEAFASASPDLVLIDFLMPGMDGIETARQMRNSNPRVLIIMVTAHTEEVVARLAAEAGIEAVIPKAQFSLARLQQQVWQRDGRRSDNGCRLNFYDDVRMKQAGDS